MYKYILIISLIFSQLHGTKINVQSFMKDDVCHIYFKIKRPKVEKKNIKSNFVTHATAIVNNNIVFDVATNSFINRKAQFKFKFKNHKKNKIIKFIITDNQSKQIEESFELNTLTNEIMKNKRVERKKHELKDYQVENYDTWKANTVEEAIKTLYGTIATQEGKISLRLPKLSPTSFIPITIKSNIKLESIAVFSRKNPYSTIMIFKIPNNAIIDYSTSVTIDGVDKVLLDNDGIYRIAPIDIIVIGKGTDNKLYKITKETEFWSCINNGDGPDDWQAYYRDKYERQKREQAKK